MASHVVVIDSSARRHNVKTTSGKYLSDVLQEACSKLGLKSELYDLKYNNKILDLSLTVRLSGLSSGAKLNLVQGSRSPSVVSVALQTSEGGRLTAKISSNSSLWHILRTFEEMDPTKPNFTQRATPQIDSSTGAGSGRLYYEMPVIRVMKRELSNFSDLQKTLAQLGLNNGSILLHLSHRNTEQPLEEAMIGITQYFQSSNLAKATTKGDSEAERTHASELLTITQDTKTRSSPAITESMSDGPSLNSPVVIPREPVDYTPADTAVTPAEVHIAENLAISTSNGFLVFAPPSSSTPIAAVAQHDEDDYTPTVEHAKAHQAALNRASQNKRLKSDAEIAAEQRARVEKLANVKEVGIRIRFPDMTILQHVFVRGDTASTMYLICREYMLYGDQEPFCLKYTDAKGKRTILPEGNQKLVEDLQWSGNLLIFVEWEAGASAAARSGQSLKQIYRAQAKQLQVDAMGGTISTDNIRKVQAPDTKFKQDAKSTGSGIDKESKMKKFLGGLSKKR